MNFEEAKHIIEESHVPERTMEVVISKADLHITPEELEGMCIGNEKLESLYEQMIQKCFEYTSDAFKLEEMAKTPMDARDDQWREDKEKADNDRRILHKATVDNINILSRNLKQEGKSNEWIGTLVRVGTSEDERRPIYGRFAIAFAFSYYLSLRRKEKEHSQ